jgi:hypothetical protein
MKNMFVSRKEMESIMSNQGQKFNISFSASILPKKEVANRLAGADDRSKEGVFSVQEIQVGGEDFVVAFGRTHVNVEKE